MKIEIRVPRIQVDPSGARELKSQLITEIDRQLQGVRTSIVRETTAGRTAEGGAFRAYSLSYAALKLAVTGSAVPNLTVTQEMLLSIRAATKQDGAELTFEGSHKTGGGLRRPKKARQDKGGKGSLPATKRARKAGSARISGGRVGKKPAAPKKAGASGGGGRTLTNAALAQHLYDKGFVDWFAVSQENLAKMEAAARKVVDKYIADKLVRVQN